MKMPASDLMVDTDVLLIDATELCHTYLSAALAIGNYDCYPVPDFQLGLNTAIVSQPSLVVLFDETNNRKLLDQCIQFTEEPSLESVPLIIILKIWDEALVESLLNAGAADVMQLPSNPRQFFYRVKPQLELHQLRSKYDSQYSELQREKKERKKIERNADFHRQMIDNIAEGVSLVRKSDTTLLYTNSIFEKIYGYLPGELLGKSVELLSGDSKKATGLVIAEIDQELGTKGSWEGDLESVRKNGEHFWCHVKIADYQHPDFGRVWLAIHEDVDIRTKKDIQLHRVEAENKAVIDAFPHIIFRIDKSGTYLDCRTPDKSLLAVHPEKLIGKNFHEILPPVISQMVEEAMEKAAINNSSVSVNYSLDLKRGERFFDALIIPVPGEEFIVFVLDTTDQVVEAAAFKETSAYLENLIVLGSVPIIVWDEQLKITRFNPSFERLTGYTEAEVLGRTLEFLLPLETREYSLGLINEVIQGKIYQSVEVPILHKNGDVKFCLWNASNILLRDGSNSLSCIAQGQDITERKRTELEIQNKARQLQNLGDNLPEAFIFKVVRNTEGAISFEYISRGVEAYIPFTLDIINANPDHFFELIHEDDRAHFWATWEKSMKELSFFNTEVRVHTLNKEIRIVNIRSRPSLRPDNSIVWDGVMIDISDQKNVENKLVENEEKYRTLVEQSSDAIVIYSIDGSIHDFNEPALKMSGYSREEFSKLRIQDIMFEKTVFLKPGNESMLKTDQSFLFNRKAVRKDGTIIELEINARLLNDGRVLANVRDISERNRAEDRIRASEERFTLVTKTTGGGIWDWDILNGKWYMSSRWYEIMGYDMEDPDLPQTKEGWYERVHKDHLEMLHQSLKAHFEQKVLYDVEYLYEHGEGNYRWHRNIGQAIFDEEGKPTRMVGSLSDIHEAKMAELALKKSLKEISDYKYALDQSANISITDANGIITYVNEKFCKQYGYSPEELIGKNHRIINSHYHPKTFWTGFWKTIRSGKVMKAEVCNKGKDGKYHWGDTSIVPFMDEEGKPYQYVAIRTDITDKRKLEKELALQQLNQQKLITEVTIQEQEKERNELGRELHDNINQILASAKLYLSLVKAGEDTTGIMLEHSCSFINEAIEEIRNLSHSLVAPTLGDISLQEALLVLINESNKAMKTEIFLVNEVAGLCFMDTKEELMIYRIVQEQLNNIRKYAKATKVIIKLMIKDKSLFMSISDNGVGFDTSQKSKGIGLRNIQNRVSFYSGFFNIISAPGEGCVMEIFIPLKEEQLAKLDGNMHSA